MARRFDLGMALNYCADWTVWRAVNEIFQNAFDAEVVNSDNAYFCEYDKEHEVLRIGNKYGVLPLSSLLLGCTTKADNPDTIGTHGEGYKVATIVLLRNNCSVTVYNYSKKEIWRAKVVNSRRYGAPVGVYDVETVGFWKTVPNNDLVFEIGGISEEAYAEVVEKNLHLQEEYQYIHTEFGDVLLDERHKGKVFVNGLYVCDKSQLSYGYDVVPSLIKLDRDRGLIDSFNLQWCLGKLLLKTNKDFIAKAKDTWDGEYIRCAYSGTVSKETDNFLDVCDDEYDKFKKKNGADAVVVTDTQAYNDYKSCGINAVYMTTNQAYYVQHSRNYVEPVVEEPKANDIDGAMLSLGTWINKLSDYLGEDILQEGIEQWGQLKSLLKVKKVLSEDFDYDVCD